MSTFDLTVHYKKCSYCKGEFPLTAEYFHRFCHSKDGFRAMCKKCRAETEGRISRPQRLGILKQLSFLEPIQVPLTRDYWARVDPIDSDLLDFKWYSTFSGKFIYAIRTVWKQSDILMHRCILERIIERPLAEGELCDHIDHDTLNNTRGNLRVATKRQNAWNSRRSADNKTGYKGVTKYGKKWYASIKNNGKTVALGYFDTAEDAHLAYCDAARRYFGEFACFE